MLHPHDFIRAHAGLTGSASPIGGVAEDSVSEPALWELPDTSIAFRRYVEAGRMVNVFDWFESFAVVLDSQRKHLRKHAAAAAEPATPSRTNGRGKRGSGKGKGKEPRRKGVEVFGAGMEKGGEEPEVAMSEAERRGRTKRRQGMRSGSKNTFRRM